MILACLNLHDKTHILVHDYLLGILVEYVNLAQIQSQLYSIARSCSGSRIYTSGAVCFVYIEVQIYFSTKHLVYTDGCVDYALRGCCQISLVIMQILRTDTQGNGLAVVALLLQYFAFFCRQSDGVTVKGQGNFSAALSNNSINQGSSAERR